MPKETKPLTIQVPKPMDDGDCYPKCPCFQEYEADPFCGANLSESGMRGRMHPGPQCPWYKENR